MRTITGRCSSATTQARRAAIASVPLEDLLSERREHQQNGTTSDYLHRRARHDVIHAGHDVATVQRAIERTKQPNAPRDPQYRQELDTNLDVAQERLRLAKTELASYIETGQPVSARAQLVEDAFTWRINAATQQPARYVIDTIGPRPAKTGTTAWDKAAHLIERVRHNHGLTPNHGPQPGTTPLARAVGETNTQWQPLTRAIIQLTSTQLGRPERHAPGIEL